MTRVREIDAMISIMREMGGGSIVGDGEKSKRDREQVEDIQRERTM